MTRNVATQGRTLSVQGGGIPLLACRCAEGRRSSGVSLLRMSKAVSGSEAEKFIVDHVHCPSCESNLVLLPAGYPLYDVACTRCLLRAQVKRVLTKPRDRIRGASWDVMSHHIRTGHLVPPMFACFGWPGTASEPSTIWFFPFIPASNVTKRVLSERHQTPGRRMTEYVAMRTVPHFIVFGEGREESPPAKARRRVRVAPRS
jgi:hypothetical protein